MKRHWILKTAGLTSLALMFLFASIAMADNTPAANWYDTGSASDQFRIVSIELPEIQTCSTVEYPFLFDGTLGKLVAEKNAYREGTQPLVYALNSKWSDFADELAKQSPEETNMTRLQDEISDLGTRLAEMRLEHLMALDEIKTSTADSDSSNLLTVACVLPTRN